VRLLSRFLKQGATSHRRAFGLGNTMTALSLLRLAPAPERLASSGFESGSAAKSCSRRASGENSRILRPAHLDDTAYPQTSLNPVFTIANQLIESIKIHHRGTATALGAEAI